MTVKSFSVKYTNYDGIGNVLDEFIINYTQKTQEAKTFSLENYYGIIPLEVVDYKISFSPKIYLPHIFIILACIGFIIPSSIALFKKHKKEK